MTDDLKQVAGEIFEVIKKSKKILLHLHPKPDPDSIGCALAMKLGLETLGKKADIIKGDSDLTAEFACLPSFNQIINKNFLEIEIGDYDLFLVLDTSGLDMISKLGPVSFPPTLTVVVIDHHQSNQHFGHYNLVDVQAPATAQILSELFDLWDIAVTPAMAGCLFLALFGDTGGFRYSGTTGKTLAIASRLADLNPDFPQILSSVLNQNKPNQLRFLGLAYSLIKTVGNQVAMIVIDHETLVKHGFSGSDTEGQSLPNHLISVQEWLIGISAKEKEPGQVYLSFRSRDGEKYDVSKLAQLFGGGGHKAAAGAVWLGTARQAEEVLTAGLKQFYPDLFRGE